VNYPSQLKRFHSNCLPERLSAQEFRVTIRKYNTRDYALFFPCNILFRYAEAPEEHNWTIWFKPESKPLSEDRVVAIYIQLLKLFYCLDAQRDEVRWPDKPGIACLVAFIPRELKL
jgi:hypothetical protein